MSLDSRIEAGVHALLQGIEAPDVPLTQIAAKMSHQRSITAARRNTRRFALAASIAAALLVSLLPLISPALVQSMDARYRAALQALGGIAPPPAPKSVTAKLKPLNATLAGAQSRVSFTIVPPAGLPKGVVSSKMVTTPTGVLSKRRHSWSIGPTEVTFWYRRADGRQFALFAAPYDPHGEQPGTYMFEARGVGAGGRPILVKHRQFAWRNGDQEMRATEGAELSSQEIFAIENAMHGVPVPLRKLYAPNTSPTTTLRVIVKP